MFLFFKKYLIVLILFISFAHMFRLISATLLAAALVCIATEKANNKYTRYSIEKNTKILSPYDLRACNMRACMCMCMLVLPDYKAISHTILGAGCCDIPRDSFRSNRAWRASSSFSSRRCQLSATLPDARSVSLPSRTSAFAGRRYAI